VDRDILNTDTDESAKIRRRTAETAVNLGLAANAVLAAGKLSAGILGHSQALLADGINSVSDVVYFVVVRVLVALSAKPADREHPYGHHQSESVAALVVGAFVMATAVAIFWESVNTAFDILTGNAEQKPVRAFALIVVTVTIAIKILLMLQASSAGRKTANLAVTALASDHRNDILASVGAGLGILFSLLGKPIFDPLAGAVVAILVFKTGIDILRASTSELMDDLPPRDIESRIRTVISGIREVETLEAVHAHRFGPYLVVNMTIGIDGGLTVSEGDRIADLAEERLCRNIEMLRRVYIHYHPASSPDEIRISKSETRK
jgi:cation diffusion facilitator family transporter